MTTGALQEDGRRVIITSVQEDDWVIVGALPQIRPRMEVRPEKVPMPTMTQAEANRVLPPPEKKDAQPPKGKLTGRTSRRRKRPSC